MNKQRSLEVIKRRGNQSSLSGVANTMLKINVPINVTMFHKNHCQQSQHKI